MGRLIRHCSNLGGYDNIDWCLTFGPLRFEIFSGTATRPGQAGGGPAAIAGMAATPLEAFLAFDGLDKTLSPFRNCLHCISYMTLHAQCV